MDFAVRAISYLEGQADTLVLLMPQFEELADGRLKKLDQASRRAVSAVVESEEFTGKAEQMVTIMAPEAYPYKRVILAGLGKREKLDHDSFRKAAGLLSRYRPLRHSRTAVFHLGRYEQEAYYQAVVEGLLLGGYKFRHYKTGEDAKDSNRLERVTFAVDQKKLEKKLTVAVERGQIIAEGQILTRQLAETPACDLTPQLYARKVQELASQHGIRCRVFDKRAIQREKMAALLAVAQGSTEPPRFVILEYTNGPKNRKPIVLVGKGVTFDSGGLSLKQAAMMPEMKGDMAGSAAVLATLVTVARLKLKVNLVGLIPAAENMPSGGAYRPGDIIGSRKGKTIEILNTDAEGRLLLADALAYADVYEPEAVIDIATLTGAALFVLGYAGAPILGNSDNLIALCRQAAENTAEKVWQLPLWDEFREQMKSSIADLKNSGGRPAGTAAAAAFLENFIGDWPWLHIDIAYVDLEPNGQAYVPKGTTGFGCRLMVDMIANWKKP
jgi:leucyl aminopeptidase